MYMPLGLLRAAALDPFIPAASALPMQRIARSGGFLVRFAARESEGREAKRGCPDEKLAFCRKNGAGNGALRSNLSPLVLRTCAAAGFRSPASMK